MSGAQRYSGRGAWQALRAGALLPALEPRLDAESAERCVFSIIGQALFYRFTLPALRLLDGLPARSRGITGDLADHITEFSLAGMERIAARRARRRHAG